MLSPRLKQKKTRVSAARGKNILIVCCGVDLSKRSIYQHLKEKFSINLLCLEERDNRLAIQLAEEGIWKHFKSDVITTNPSDPNYLDTIMEEIRQGEKEHSLKIDGVFTIWDDAVGLSVRIAHSLGLPGNSIESIDIAHDKYLTRVRLEERGINCPANALISQGTPEKSVLEAAASMNMPLIIKPGSGGSSIGVRKVVNRDDIYKEYLICLETIGNALKDKELMGINMGTNSATDIVIEEFMDGVEVDVDVILCDGEILYKQVMDDWPYRDPWFCELGCHFPSALPLKKREAFYEAAREVIDAIGITEGVHHIEFIDDKVKGPTLVECNPRMGGGPVYNFHKGAFGIDLMEEVLLSSLGLTQLPREAPYPKEGPENSLASCVAMVCHARTSGVLNCNVKQILEEASRDPHVALAAAMSEEGDRVTGWDDGFPTSMARIDIVTSELNIAGCLAKAERLKESFYASITYEQ